MSLFEEHKAERRARILKAAREIIASSGYERLTMRDLARASRVSVPTLYNLFGSKQALLLGELEVTFDANVAAIESVQGGNVVDRALASCDAGNADLMAVPRYSRELIFLFLTDADNESVRRNLNERYACLMADVLRQGQAAGEIEKWIDPLTLTRRMFAHYLFTMIEWARGELDTEGFRSATRFGMCVMLLAVARGRARQQLTAEIEALQKTMKTERRPKSRTRKGGES